VLCCDVCGVCDETVSYQADPYMEEICDKIEMKNLCKKCYRESCDDI